GQTLKDPETAGATTRQIGVAGDLNVRVKIDRIRLRADVSYRDLAFILHSQSGLPAYEQIPMGFTTSANAFAAVGADHNWGDWLTLGVIFGVEKPATLTAPAGVPVIPGAGSDPSRSSTAVIRNNNVDTSMTVLPVGESAGAQFAVKATAKVD